MKTWCFEGGGVHSQSYKYEIEVTSAELAKEIGIPVEKVEAMSKEEMEAHMKENIYDLEGLVDNITDADNISWGDTEYNCDSDFYLDINEDGEE
jgi:hypothetical protein